MLNYSSHNLLLKAVIMFATLLTSTSAYAEDSNLVRTKAIPDLTKGIAQALTGQFAASPLTKSQVIAQAVVVPGANNMSQVKSVSQLSDVQPNDWAFQSLQSLVERYGCIAGYPNGTYRGNSAISRDEFAAGLNACLSRVNELIVTGTSDLVTKEDLAILQRLQEEFATELTTLRSRVDTLEPRTAELEANQFSRTTKWVLWLH